MSIKISTFFQYEYPFIFFFLSSPSSEQSQLYLFTSDLSLPLHIHNSTLRLLQISSLYRRIRQFPSLFPPHLFCID